MPEIIVYTNDGDCANGVAEIQPFTTGDATDEWTLRFNNGTDFYAVSNVTMRVGHVNGLPAGTYNSAFKWVDRKGTESTANITISAAGVPSISISPTPAGGLIGDNGVYIFRGPDLDGAITSIQIVQAGLTLDQANSYLRPGVPFGLSIDSASNEGNLVSYRYPNAPASQVPLGDRVILGIPDGSGTAFASAEMVGDGGSTSRSVASVTLHSGGKGFPRAPLVSVPFAPLIVADTLTFSSIDRFERQPSFLAIGNWPEYEFPFMKDESGNNIIAATTLSPYSDGDVEDSTQYNNSTLVVRPETVASASSLTASGSGSSAKWTATMNPINAYVTERLALRNSTQLDLQIRGDGRTLFQGQLPILNKIA
tara:strand:- start:12 stop:1112 length:1101 start_codon:yes stop_codon:yes gene_type:complete